MIDRFAKLSPGIKATVLAACAVFVVGLWWWFSRPDTRTGYSTAPVEQGDIRVAISATGTLRALSTVDIGSQVSGQVLSVEVDFNEVVRAGQAIAHIDPAPMRSRLTQAEANLASAQAGLTEAQAALKNAEADYARKLELAQRQLVSGSEVDLALAARDQARARIASSRASVRQAEAAVASAQLDLNYTVIRSPVDGVVLLRAVEPGQTVAASFQTPMLFQIVEDLSKMQIDLSIDETDVGQVREGQRVEFTVDAYPNRRFSGLVHQIRLSATNVANVITYPVVVRVDNPDGALLPGMTANAEIEVSRRSEVVRIPNAALRFRPPDAEPATAQRGALFSQLPQLADHLGLDQAQRAQFDAVLAGMRERFQAGGARPQGAPNGGSAPGGSPDAFRQRMTAMLTEQFGDFRAGLSADQQAAFDAFLAARPVSVWVLESGRPVERSLRVGLSDNSHTELVSGPLSPGDAVIVGVEAPRA